MDGSKRFEGPVESRIEAILLRHVGLEVVGLDAERAGQGLKLLHGLLLDVEHGDVPAQLAYGAGHGETNALGASRD